MSKAKKQVGIVGASGYGGSELARLLQSHPDIAVATLAAHSQAGQPVAGLFPNLAGDQVFDPIDVDQLAALDLVFLATPHGPSLDLAAGLTAAGTKVVDLSGAFRLTREAFAIWYGEDHTRPELLPAVYGLTEHFRDEVASATLVANPGCYPTATLLALRPVVDLIRPNTVVVDAKSGTSGAGRAAKDTLHFAHVHADVSAYGAPGHRHTGEIEQWTGGEIGPVQFTPHLMPMARGLLSSVTAAVAEGVTLADIGAALDKAYGHEPFVHVLAPGQFPHTKALAGSNGAQISAALDERTGRLLLTCAIDNLGKGAAGQAIQNANLMLGLDEVAGLSAVGVYP